MTESSRERQERFIRNHKVVKEMGETLGFRLIGIDPSWGLASTGGDRKGFSIPDEVMGEIAKLAGKEWEARG